MLSVMPFTPFVEGELEGLLSEGVFIWTERVVVLELERECVFVVDDLRVCTLVIAQQKTLYKEIELKERIETNDRRVNGDYAQQL
jgi:hypothetical protein